MPLAPSRQQHTPPNGHALPMSSFRVVQLTAPGRGAVATLAVSGPDALAAVQRHFRPVGSRALGQLAADRPVVGHFGAAGEEVVVRRKSAESLELHCHGGDAAVARIVQTLVATGGRHVHWRAHVAESGPDPLAAAALTALAEARTERTATILLAQYHGALRHALQQVAASVARGDVTAARSILAELLARQSVGLHLTRPWRVVLAGPPNAGKSSLINALVGYQRAIVHPVAGTTRDVVTASTAMDGWPVELSDTAGLRQTEYPLERAGMDLARRKLSLADLVVLVFDATQPWTAAEQRLLEGQSAPLIVHNKSDLLASEPSARPAGQPTSALLGQGISSLVESMVARLVPSVPAADAPVPFTEAQFDALRGAAQSLAAGDGHDCLAQIAALAG